MLEAPKSYTSSHASLKVSARALFGTSTLQQPERIRKLGTPIPRDKIKVKGAATNDLRQGHRRL